ncbi:MAG: hypothetical protein P8X69_01800 [Maritimibacter sp.]
MVSAKALLLSAGFSLSGAAMAAETPYFQTGFESEADFAGVDITPVKPGGSDGQELSWARRYSSEFSHHAWIVAPNPESTLLTNRNHRAYPTIQFQHLSSGPVPTPFAQPSMSGRISASTPRPPSGLARFSTMT